VDSRAPWYLTNPIHSFTHGYSPSARKIENSWLLTEARVQPFVCSSSGGVKISKLGIPWPLNLVESNISIKQISISNLLQNIRNTRTLHSLYGYSYTIHAMLQYHITSLCIYVIFQIAYWHFTWYSKRDESTSIYKCPWSLMPTSTLFCYKYLTLDFSFILIH